VPAGGTGAGAGGGCQGRRGTHAATIPGRDPLLVIAAGIVAIAIGTLFLRSYGPRVRIGRLLAVTPSVTLAEARDLAASGARRYVRVEGRLDADEEFPDEHGRPLVLRRRRIEARLRGGWSILDEQVQAVPFRLRRAVTCWPWTRPRSTRAW